MAPGRSLPVRRCPDGAPPGAARWCLCMDECPLMPRCYIFGPGTLESAQSVAGCARSRARAPVPTRSGRRITNTNTKPQRHWLAGASRAARTVHRRRSARGGGARWAVGIGRAGCLTQARRGCEDMVWPTVHLMAWSLCDARRGGFDGPEGCACQSKSGDGCGWQEMGQAPRLCQDLAVLAWPAPPQVLAYTR